jgi:hypothetical protein
MRDVNHNYGACFGVNPVVSVMVRSPNLFGPLAFSALIGILVVAFTAPASAEFFTCSQRPGQLLYSYSGTPDQYAGRRHHYSAPRYYSRSASRYYRAGSSRYRRHATYYSDRRYWNGR